MRTRELWINRMSRTATFASLFNCSSQSKDTYKERHITLHATVLHFGLLHKRMCMRSAEFIKTKRICNSCKSNGSAARWLGRARRLCVFVATSHTVRSMLAAISSAHSLYCYASICFGCFGNVAYAPVISHCCYCSCLLQRLWLLLLLFHQINFFGRLFCFCFSIWFSYYAILCISHRTYLGVRPSRNRNSQMFFFSLFLLRFMPIGLKIPKAHTHHRYRWYIARICFVSLYLI